LNTAAWTTTITVSVDPVVFTMHRTRVMLCPSQDPSRSRPRLVLSNAKSIPDAGLPSTPPIPIRMEHQFPSVSASMHWDSASYCALTSARWPGGMVTALTAPGTLTNVVELVMKNAVSVPTRPR